MSQQTSELSIFSRVCDFLDWLATVSLHFPRSHRHTTTRRLLDTGFDLLERLVEANRLRGAARLERLAVADAELDKIRLYLRLAYRWRWLSSGQYEHASRLETEIGRLLGGWIKATETAPRQPKPDAPSATPAPRGVKRET